MESKRHPMKFYLRRKSTSAEPVSEEESAEFEKSFESQGDEEDLETTLPLVEDGDGFHQSEEIPEPIEQEPLNADIKGDIQVYDEVTEGTIESAPLQNIPTTAESAFDATNVADESNIEPVNLNDGWIPIDKPSLEMVKTTQAESSVTPEMPEGEKTTGQTPSTDQVQLEPQKMAGEITGQEPDLAEEAILSQELEDEITKPVQITTQDSSVAVQAEAESDTSRKMDQISDEGSVEIDTPAEEIAQTEEEASEKKHGFLAWLKSVKSVVQEEIKEPKLPAWMQTGKPSERIKVPEISDLLDQEPGKKDEIPPQPEMQQPLHAEEISEEEQEIILHEDDGETLEVEAERDEFSPPPTEEDEVWEVGGYQAEEIEGAVEPVIMEQPKYIEDLERARLEVNQGNFVKAAERYKKIIKTSKNLNNVILSLEEAVQNNPGELKLIQTLGDAYVRTGRLQDALDAYTKAEELLK